MFFYTLFLNFNFSLTYWYIILYYICHNKIIDMNTLLNCLFNKIENCKKHIEICKNNYHNIDISREFLDKEIIRLNELKNKYQLEFNKAYENI